MNRIIAGKYEILKEVGKGGMSIVYLAADLNLNKNWAIKEIPKSGIINGQHVTNQLLAEAELMKDLDHPALPRITDILEEKNRYYIVMDYVEGENLKKVIDEYGPQDQEQVIRWSLELCGVLQYLHSLDPPIIYRDMKPANIILQPNNTLKLIDFGIARTYKAGKTEDTMPLGTRGYAAPEQFNTGGGQSGQTDSRTDIYNLGVTIYELLTCKLPTKPPYELLPLRTVDPRYSAGLETIIEKCTRSNPDERFQNVETLAEAILNHQKFDAEYVQKQKKKLKKTAIPFIFGMVFLLSSTVLFIINGIVSANNYESLIAQTGDSSRKENLKRAIELFPEKPDAYALLSEEYSQDGGIDEKESAEILAVYNENIPRVNDRTDEYIDINYGLGESYLLHFTGKTDNSVRNKLINALPFFRAVKETENTEHERYAISCAYVELAQFYKDYVIGSSDIFAKEAAKDDYKRLIKQSNILLDHIEEEKDNNQLRVISYRLLNNILMSEIVNIANCIEEKDVEELLGKIKYGVLGMDTTNAALTKEKENILNDCDEVAIKTAATYINTKKVERSRANESNGYNSNSTFDSRD